MNERRKDIEKRLNSAASAVGIKQSSTAVSSADFDVAFDVER